MHSQGHATNTWIIILKDGVSTSEPKCSHRNSSRKVYVLCLPNTLKELLWKLLEQHITSRRCSPHRGEGFSLVAQPLQGKFVSSYVLKLEMDMLSVLLSPFITLTLQLCLESSMLTLCYWLLHCWFRQTAPVKEAALRLSPKLWDFPAELQNTIPPPTLTWPLALEIQVIQSHKCPFSTKQSSPVAFLYPPAHGNCLPPPFKCAIRANYEQAESSVAAAFQWH